MSRISAHPPHATRSGRAYLIRSVERRDAEKLLDFARETSRDSDFTLTLPEEFDLTVDEEAGWIQGLLDEPGSVGIVAEHEGEIVGMLDFAAGDRARIAHAGELGVSVARGWRREGVGEALMRALLGWAASHPQVEKVSLRVHVGNEPAVALYRKLGFVQEGVFKRDLKYADGRYADTYYLSKFVKEASR